MPELSSRPGIVLLGAAGRMGRAIAARFLVDGKVDLAGAVDSVEIGSNIGDLTGCETAGPAIAASVDDLDSNLKADIVLDFSTVEGNRSNLEACLKRGWDVLIGVTGFTEDDTRKFSEASGKYKKRIVLVPNFTPGVNLMLRFAKEASKVFERVEIIELHHDKKVDAPSGTALHTAKLISDARTKPDALTPEDRSRGRIEDGIPIHAVRLPGLLAHQEILFGSDGEVLTIRHDTTDRGAFLSGIYLAIEKMPGLEPGFVKGLDWVFD
jgi:4-hydroxy-tetrahydrodipicolinate reductase